MIPLWLTNIWVRRAILAVVVVIALLAVRQHYINLGKTQGVATESQHSAESNAAGIKSDRDNTVPQITVLTQQMTILQQQTSSLQQLVASLALQRQQLPQQMNGLTAAQVEDIIAKHLGKPAGQPDTPQDRKSYAQCFEDLDLCNGQVKAQVDTIGTLNTSVGKSTQRYDLLAGYTTRLEAGYVTLWNDKAVAQRKPWCLWVCKRKPKIAAPNPKDLLQRPAEAPAIERNANDAPAQ